MKNKTNKKKEEQHLDVISNMMIEAFFVAADQKPISGNMITTEGNPKIEKEVQIQAQAIHDTLLKINPALKVEYLIEYKTKTTRVYFYRPDYKGSKLLTDLKDAYGSEDDKTIGLLLGYPNCCVDKFIKEKRPAKRYIKESIDNNLASICGRHKEIEGFLGIREPLTDSQHLAGNNFPYIPCSPGCTKTLKELEKRYLTLIAMIIEPFVEEYNRQRKIAEKKK
jgi:hypothetical protein